MSGAVLLCLAVVGGSLRVHSLGIQHHHLIDDDLGAGSLLTVCGVVASGLETPFNVDLSPLLLTGSLSVVFLHCHCKARISL